MLSACHTHVAEPVTHGGAKLGHPTKLNFEILKNPIPFSALHASRGRAAAILPLRKHAPPRVATFHMLLLAFAASRTRGAPVLDVS